jgi:hypothetical protein
MHKLRKDKTAVSEVSGALMLTLIVVIAASSFAVYVAEKQKVEQDNQELQDQRKQESLSIVSITPLLNITTNVIDNVTFLFSSNHVIDSKITRIAINDFVVKHYNITTDSPYIPKTYEDSLIIESRDSIRITVNYSDCIPKLGIDQNRAITISLDTELNNIFQKSFMPPTSLIAITTESLWNSTLRNFSDFIILDGSASSQIGGGYVTSWQWNITHWNSTSNIETPYPDLTGQKVRFEFPEPGQYNITLTVQNNYGMKGSSDTKYFH